MIKVKLELTPRGRADLPAEPIELPAVPRAGECVEWDDVTYTVRAVYFIANSDVVILRVME